MSPVSQHASYRLLIIALVILTTMTGSMILLRLTQHPAYLWLAMASPAAGVVTSALHGWFTLGRKNIGIFFLVTVSGSLLLETFGVATGLLYGPYHYTYRLGPLFLGLTPYLIPITWFMMLYPAYIMSWIITNHLPINHQIINRLVTASIGGLIMTSWDLVLDPVMAKQSHWIWETEGIYFGIPLQNFFGWWLTSFIILYIYETICSRKSPVRHNLEMKTGFISIWIYAIIGFGNIAGAAITGLWGPALIAAGAMGFWVVIAWFAGKASSYLLEAAK